MIRAKYTIVLKTLMDNTQSMAYLNDALSHYPLYESTSARTNGMPQIIPTREELNKKILDHFKYREIGFETPGRFYDELKIKMNEIMPYYNQFFYSTDVDYNLLDNVDYTRTHTQTNVNTMSAESSSEKESNASAQDSSTTSSTENNYNKHLEDDTPQSALNTTELQIDTVNYASQVNFDKTQSNSSGNSSGSSSSSAVSNSSDNTSSDSEGTEHFEEHIKGNYGMATSQAMVKQYRDTILNIEMQIIKELEHLFMLIF